MQYISFTYQVSMLWILHGRRHHDALKPRDEVTKVPRFQSACLGSTWPHRRISLCRRARTRLEMFGHLLAASTRTAVTLYSGVCLRIASDDRVCLGGVGSADHAVAKRSMSPPIGKLSAAQTHTRHHCRSTITGGEPAMSTEICNNW
jgi:hypothetical protein